MLPIVTGLYELEQALAARGAPRPVALRRQGAGAGAGGPGRWVATVWPANMLNVFFPRFRGEVWMKPGAAPSQGEVYRRKREGRPLHGGRVALVLGARGCLLAGCCLLVRCCLLLSRAGWMSACLPLPCP